MSHPGCSNASEPVDAHIPDTPGLRLTQDLLGGAAEAASLLTPFGGGVQVIKGGVRTILTVDSAGAARIFINEAELSVHAAQQASARGVTLGEISQAVSSGAQFTYRQAGSMMTGFYDRATKVFVGLGNEYSTVIRAGENYIKSLMRRQ
jgi:hypothetical protein